MQIAVMQYDKARVSFGKRFYSVHGLYTLT